MVLTELGSRITGALKKLQTATVIDEAVLDECLKEIATALLHADVNVQYVARLRGNVKKRVAMEDVGSGVNKRKLIQKCVVEEMVNMLTPHKEPFVPKKGKPNVIMFVGLQGSGKTTTCTKYAHHYQRKGFRPALVCADTFRAGAFDQLKQNATKAKIPFYGSYSETDPVRIAEEGVEQFRAEGCDLIIVDTSGRHKQEASLFEEMKQVAEAVDPDEFVFVMDSHIGQACFDQATAFRQAVPVGSVIVTKLDGHAKGGGALSAVAATESPVIFIGTGEHFDDFESFEPKSFVSRLLGMGDITGLFNTIKDVMPADKQPELMNRISQGIFTLRDLSEQFQNVLKMGPMGRVMSMIPGMPTDILGKEGEKAGVNRIKRFLTMMDSMTDAELDSDKTLAESRVNRVAKGSGCHPLHVKELLEEHKKFHKMVTKMGKMGFAKKSSQQEMQQMMRNPKQMMSKMSQMMDPRILQQMGGAGNVMDMMKQMSKMEGMGGMGDMMKQFGGGM
uniref:Signal recognition particle 54 kDa protein n=1 Tax=Chromera velia CCMP2878 TaxID=1169474 RepID=A0A0G4FST3_9ALVE|mmetsp:Transcript_34009/g.67338  ORF Transcript_34009/g.67338 Transcript_34009/m.67338 type:complete len:504 (+) Transcript_34009:209-1720(+)|eukprot:Cvel_18574.t1-p1 / transcript=Cvel_18574.t1 / gene=Cvel_18574 / organism=Chromera_velia_CCMP2878 / gene_product=Signal recognition particle 54 kDa protein 2, putative / transcript_product=Signal recognition particle 54 kDa protein 2, putative / location=Cvel_scaffold1548:40427-43416(-) / protein_length=503 / sequence_SO=supercontig / SO=protein_coding / is_pseudo=false